MKYKEIVLIDRSYRFPPMYAPICLLTPLIIKERHDHRTVSVNHTYFRINAIAQEIL